MGRYLALPLDLLWFCGSDVVDASVILTFFGLHWRATPCFARRMFWGKNANGSSLFHYFDSTFRSIEVGFKRGVISDVSFCQ